VHAVVQALLQTDRRRNFDRLILAGGTAGRSQIELALPTRLRRKIAASVNLPVDASREQVLEVVQRIEEEAERTEEVQIVEKLLTAASKGRGATVGLQKTLQAVAQGQVHQLVYADNFLSDTGACLNCGAIQPNEDSGCTRCGDTPEPAPRLLDAVVNRVERNRGKVEVVKGKAAALMVQENEGIGAFLRF
jgi:stalled ribosome rescue protein Dom34